MDSRRPLQRWTDRFWLVSKIHIAVTGAAVVAALWALGADFDTISDRLGSDLAVVVLLCVAIAGLNVVWILYASDLLTQLARRTAAALEPTGEGDEAPEPPQQSAAEPPAEEPSAEPAED